MNLPPQNEKQPFLKTLRYAPRYEPWRRLAKISFILGLAFTLYSLGSDVYSFVIGSVPALYERYTSDITFSYLCQGIYSFLCVGLPFFLALVLLISPEEETYDIPLGKPNDHSRAVLLVIAAVGLCFFGNYVTGYFTAILKSMGVEFYSYRMMADGEPLPGDAWGLAVFALRTAFIPAVVEEFALRGVVLQSLRKYGDWFAIGVSAVMFGLMHGNMTQVPFALIAGIGLGYCFVTTGTLWCSIAVHFVNNFTAVLSQIIANRQGQAADRIFTLLSSVVLIGSGVIALLVYCMKTPSFARLYPGEYPKMKKKLPVFFLTPTVLYTVISMLIIMFKDIVR